MIKNLEIQIGFQDDKEPRNSNSQRAKLQANREPKNSNA